MFNADCEVRVAVCAAFLWMYSMGTGWDICVVQAVHVGSKVLASHTPVTWPLKSFLILAAAATAP